MSNLFSCVKQSKKFHQHSNQSLSGNASKNGYIRLTAILLFSAIFIDTLNIGVQGDRAKLLPYTNFYVEVLSQYWIKLLHVEVLTNVRIKLLHIEVLTIFPDKTSTLTKSIKITPQL